MSEKLTAFLSLYSSRASAEVEETKTQLAEYREKWKKVTEETYPVTLKTATDLGQLEKFQKVFPAPGRFVNDTLKYSDLLNVDDSFKLQLKELFRSRNLESRIENFENHLAISEDHVKNGGEEYIGRLINMILQKTGEYASNGANPNTIISNLFKSPEDYAEMIGGLIDTIPGPPHIMTAPETYAVLLEKKEAGGFTSTAKKEESTKESSPINETLEETASGKTSSPINDNEALKNDKSVSSPINNDAAKKAETTETTGAAQATVATKPAELKTEETPIKPEESKDININLESKTPSTDTKNGEVFSSSSAINTNTDNSTQTKTESTGVSVTNTAINNTETNPSVNSDSKKSVFKSVVNNLKDSALNSLNITNNSGIVDDFKNYLGVGAEKLAKVTKPTINAYNTIQKAVTDAKSQNTSVTTSSSAVNSPVTANTSNAEGDVNTQMTSSQTTVDSKSPAIPNDVKLATQSTANNTSLIEKSSNQSTANNDKVTYNESTQIGTPAKTKTASPQTSQIIQQSAPSNINISELVNEMRAIKLLLMGGIDVNHK